MTVNKLRQRVLANLYGHRPRRKRGYHRALKRGETWALAEQACIHLMNALAFKMFYPEPCKLAKLVGLRESIDSEGLPVVYSHHIDNKD